MSIPVHVISLQFVYYYYLFFLLEVARRDILLIFTNTYYPYRRADVVQFVKSIPEVLGKNPAPAIMNYLKKNFLSH